MPHMVLQILTILAHYSQCFPAHPPFLQKEKLFSNIKIILLDFGKYLFTILSYNLAKIYFQNSN
jgi:hypothetical protein